MSGYAAQTRLRRASPESTADVDAVLAVLDETAAWLHTRGISQWPTRFRHEWVSDAIARGTTWLATVRGVEAATVTLDWSDPLWPDDADAGYVHRLAVRRGHAGLGAILLDWAAAAVRDEGRPFLRLDCVADNARLRAYYEAAGFAFRGDAQVDGAPGELTDRRIGAGAVPAAGNVTVSRYERPVRRVTGCARAALTALPVDPADGEASATPASERWG